MRDALGNLALGHHVDDLRSLFAASVDERELRGDGSLAPFDVGGSGLVKKTQAYRGNAESQPSAAAREDLQDRSGTRQMRLLQELPAKDR